MRYNQGWIVDESGIAHVYAIIIDVYTTNDNSISSIVEGDGGQESLPRNWEFVLLCEE